VFAEVRVVVAVQVADLESCGGDVLPDPGRILDLAILAGEEGQLSVVRLRAVGEDPAGTSCDRRSASSIRCSSVGENRTVPDRGRTAMPRTPSGRTTPGAACRSEIDQLVADHPRPSRIVAVDQDRDGTSPSAAALGELEGTRHRPRSFR
jgi:hypothetical protein